MLNLKPDFPIFNHHPNLVYLDTASSALKPRAVVEATTCWYEKFGVNVHRALYDLGDEATVRYESVRDAVAKFLNAEREEIIFTNGTTAGLNKLARMLEPTIKTGDSIVLTRMEHHANLIPWQELAKRTNAKLKFIELTADYQLDLESAKNLIDNKTKIVSFTAASNVLGTITPAKKIIEIAHEFGAVAIVDAAHIISHKPINVTEIDCDFLVFSGHKLYGPTGVGVLYGKKELLKKLEPIEFGGDMIKRVSYQSGTWADLPYKFEAGTPPIAEVIGLGAALWYLKNVGWENIQAHEKELMEYTLEKLSPEVKIIGSITSKNRVSTFSFVIDGAHPHDVAEILNRDNIAVRAGHHCAMPLMEHLELVGTVRASLGIYNTKKDIDVLVAGIKKVKKILRV
ncbi:MAG: hypothetical protein A2821_04710 [Candidatus Magasanikbacteria bacterium RIFCSPHIGHO2_01_FULL_41_23]|uniref:Cysteine desulfurase n=1 Tax=Candidatus Magasanikbacteria bacterium RIFCSPLOWO2_01_FULL_40_15 TaxID=1798686 RepID=A0A1F6N362_9BACT|nr:MAG: hypothetical protein A2821_04710 [Candidatus Magasanikbacteria bacterium RIFCSPHIGHO2_01_FULL_41_23]OGH74604.1 MAG: hypothetical protein A3F22_03575 [Candidatus Magasanikbacteria bacterium RIFCSPHIGHO2_12_FULL_41_16]OGH78436.1 MAG: hypothetical protein A2983_04665 [Candidatus Magasanikbacteria bacterium RIFCSPLOWO2_01_FULL_40_15]